MPWEMWVILGMPFAAVLWATLCLRGLRGALTRGGPDDDTAEFFAWCDGHWAVESDPAPVLRSVQ